MENAQVEATVDTRTDPWFLTVLPCLLGFLRQVVAARLLPQVWGEARRSIPASSRDRAGDVGVTRRYPGANRS